MIRKLCILFVAMAIPSTAQAVLITSGTIEIPATYAFDFETGDLGVGDDIFWEQISVTQRRIRRPIFSSNSEFIALGAIDFGALSEVDLTGLAFSPTYLDGPPGGSDLDVNDVFAVRTEEGNYAKAIVRMYDNGVHNIPFSDMHIQYALFSGVPEPSGFLLIGLVATGWLARRRARNILYPKGSGFRQSST